MENWDYKALINSYNFVRLTSDSPSEHGFLFSKTPLEASDWFVEFSFEIGGKGRFAGDGMAFWFTEKPYQPGAAFGHDESFKGLGVFLDTYRNADHAVRDESNVLICSVVLSFCLGLCIVVWFVFVFGLCLWFVLYCIAMPRLSFSHLSHLSHSSHPFNPSQPSSIASLILAQWSETETGRTTTTLTGWEH